MITRLVLVVCLVFSVKAFADKGATDERTGAWLGTFTNKKLNENYSFWAETQLRYGLDIGRTRQILYRTGILQKISEKHQFGYLYAYIQSATLNEHRFAFQHVQKYGEVSDYSLSHRVRFEARFLEDNDDDAGRFRYLFRANQSDKTNNVVFWNEVFINLTTDSWNGEQAFDRNRLFLGLRRKFFDSNIEFGYLNQYIPRYNRDISEHLFVIYFFL
ncbi:MAG: DUF2490 domain-containing protein [Bdellovibrionales bacterium]|nr:DUF2490 domain-containing protein [Bdellovibrionales bacterium]